MTKNFSIYKKRVSIVTVGALVVWGVLLIRLFTIQVIQSKQYQEVGEKQSTQTLVLKALRGTIYDRDSNPLAENTTQYSIGANPSFIEQSKKIAGILSTITGKNSGAYLSKLKSQKSFVYLEKNIKQSEISALLTVNDRGLVIDRVGYRVYPHANIPSQLIGYTDVDNIGIEGIERTLDKYLAGKDGWLKLQTDGLGRTYNRIGLPRKEPVDGYNVRLTIDIDYQTILRDELKTRIGETGAQGGMGILMEPTSGKILAMVSVPDFDPNARQTSLSDAYRNRVVTDLFEPGSTFKIVTATAALETDRVGLTDEFHCGFGQISVSGHIIKDWNEFGILTFPEIIQNSSNVGVIQIAQRVGTEKFFYFARKFGFGQETGIDFLPENSGVLHHPDEWSAISMAEISLGHEISTTTLQLASAYCAIANGGYLMKPILVERIVDDSGTLILHNQPQILRKIASEETMTTLRKMLESVVESGTGTNAKLTGWHIAGKTGTAQKPINGMYTMSHFISSFAGFVPSDNPKLVGVIVLDEPRKGSHYGGIAAAPVFKNVVKRIIQEDDDIFEIPKSESTKPAVKLASVVKPVHVPSESKPITKSNKNPVVLSMAFPMKKDVVVVPDVKGLSMREAMRILREQSLNPKISGSGVVVMQSPQAGSKVNLQTTCQLELR